MEEKKSLKVSLGMTICIFIIVILIGVLVGTIVYYNIKNKEGNNISNEQMEENIYEIAKNLYERAEAEIVDLQANGELYRKYELENPRLEKEINGEIYVATTEKFEVIENKYKQIFTDEELENILKNERFANVDGTLYVSILGGGSGWETTINNLEIVEQDDEKITFVGYGKLRENDYYEDVKVNFTIKKVNGEYRISKINSETSVQIEQVAQDIIDVEEFYVSIPNEEQEKFLEFEKIGFSSGDKFIIEGSSFEVTGKYELLDENVKRCIIEKYSFNEPDGKKTISIIDNGWYIDFKTVEKNKIRIVSNNVEWGSEISNYLCNQFVLNKEFATYDINDFIGTWTSSYAYVPSGDTEGYIKGNLTDIFGTMYLTTGSTFTLKKDGSFEDLIFPTTEGNLYRNGSYLFEEGNKIRLTYSDDGSKFVEIYIIDENKIAYNDDWNHIIILEK